MYPVAFGVKGENAGDYQIEAMEISVTKGTLESMDSKGVDTKVTKIPYDTDYDAEVFSYDIKIQQWDWERQKIRVLNGLKL